MYQDFILSTIKSLKLTFEWLYSNKLWTKELEVKVNVYIPAIFSQEITSQEVTAS